MSRLRLNKVATPTSPAANKAEVFYSSTQSPIALAAIDESGNLCRLGGFATKDYRFVKQVNILNGTTTYTPTSGTTGGLVQCIGAGGSGGGAASPSAGQATCGMGGGGGAYSSKFVTWAQGASSIVVAVGAGATGNLGAAGSAGGDTKYNTNVVIAKGGRGGAVLTTGVSVTSSSTANHGQASGGAGDVTIDGGSGGDNLRFSGTQAMGGYGGASLVAAGPPGQVAGGTGNSAVSTANGSGGAGATQYNTAAAVGGGVSAAGIMLIDEYA